MKMVFVSKRGRKKEERRIDSSPRSYEELGRRGVLVANLRPPLLDFSARVIFS